MPLFFVELNANVHSGHSIDFVGGTRSMIDLHSNQLEERIWAMEPKRANRRAAWAWSRRNKRILEHFDRFNLPLVLMMNLSTLFVYIEIF